VSTVSEQPTRRSLLPTNRGRQTQAAIDAAARTVVARKGILAATIADPALFRSGREFAAFLGLVPRQSSSGGKERLGRISKMGDRYLRTLLVVGATAVLRHAKAGGSSSRVWAEALLAKKPFKLVAVALANKTARIAWAVMARGEVFREGIEVRAKAA